MFSTGKTVSVCGGAWSYRVRSIHYICLSSRHYPTLPLSQYYRCLVNVPREVCWWQRGSAHAGQAQLILNTQSPLRASFQGGAMFGKHHDQKITEGRVGGEHGSLLTDLTPEPSRGGLRDVCQQDVVLSTALGLSYHSQSVSLSVSLSQQLTSTLSPV